MSFAMAENWDTLTPPALPPNWTVTAGIVSTATYSNSSPNSIKIGTASAGVNFATYTVSDGGGGYAVDQIGYLYFESSVSSGDTASAGVTLRCSSSTMDNSSTSCYWVRITAATTGTGQYLKFSKVVNGTVTDLASLQNTDSGLIKGTWYLIRVLSAGSNLFTVSLARVSDGYWLNSSGVFASPSAVAITLTAADITSGGYYGYAGTVGTAIGNTSNKVYFDGLTVNASPGLILPPRRPLVVPVPFQYYNPE